MANLDTGNTGFMILCSSLVMLMTPGLAFFYGGLVSRKNVLAIMMQSFVSMGWTTVIWFAVGYSLCFSGDVGGVIGNLDMAFLHGVTLATPSPFGVAVVEQLICPRSRSNRCVLAMLVDQELGGRGFDGFPRAGGHSRRAAADHSTPLGVVCGGSVRLGSAHKESPTPVVWTEVGK